ncbi:MAG: hypothetical protein ABR569_09545 [Gaiellaceae bacterium]
MAAALASLSLVVPVKTTLTAPGHSPKVRVRWAYVVRATQGGRPAAARITVQTVDPLGNVHPVQFGSTTKPIVRRPFSGVFRDYIRWPAAARGIPLTLRVTVVVAHTRRIIRYAVTPR